MRLRIIDSSNKKSVFIDAEAGESFEVLFSRVEEAFGNRDLFDDKNLHPSVYVDAQQQRIKCCSAAIQRTASLADSHLTTGILLLRAKAADTNGDAKPLTPTSGTSNTASPTVTVNYRERLWAMYARYDPARVRLVDGTLAKYKGKEEAVIKALVQKYGAEPSEGQVEALRAESVQTPKEEPASAPCGESVQTPKEEPVAALRTDERITPQCVVEVIETLESPSTYTVGSPPISPVHNCVSDKETRYRSTVVKCTELLRKQSEKSVLSSYYSAWMRFIYRRRQERLLSTGMWKRASAGYQLVDDVVPSLLVGSLSDRVERQLKGENTEFSDELQKSLRRLFWFILRNSVPRFNANEKTSKIDKGNDSLRPAVRSLKAIDLSHSIHDTPATVAALGDVLNHFQYHRDTSSRLQSVGKAHDELQVSHAALVASSNSIQTQLRESVAKVKALESELRLLRKQRKDKVLVSGAHSSAGPKKHSSSDGVPCRSVSTHAGTPRAPITGDDRRNISLRREHVGSEEKPSLRHSQPPSIQSKVRSARCPSPAFISTRVQHGMFSDPRMSVVASKMAAHHDPVGVRKPLRTDAVQSELLSPSRLICPLCSCALAPCSRQDSSQRTAFCFSCRRSLLLSGDVDDEEIQ